MTLTKGFESLKVKFDTIKALQSPTRIVLICSLAALTFGRGFVCPCVTREAAETACGVQSKGLGSDGSKCVPLYNRWFSSTFFVLPTIILFVLVPGECIKREKLRESIRPQYDSVTHDCQACKIERARYLQKCLGFVLVPVAWIVFALLDGRYYACGQTPLPYDVGNGTCREEFLKESREYKDNQIKSTILGIRAATLISIVALVVFLWIYCHNRSSQEKMRNNQVLYTCKVEAGTQTAESQKSPRQRKAVKTILDYNEEKSSTSTICSSVTTRSMKRCRGRLNCGESTVLKWG